MCGEVDEEGKSTQEQESARSQYVHMYILSVNGESIYYRKCILNVTQFDIYYFVHKTINVT